MRVLAKFLTFLGLGLFPVFCFAAMNSNELQRVLAITDAKWHEPMLSIALYYEAGDFAKGDELLDGWLTENFYEAMQMLPALDNFVFHYEAHSPAPIYERHLRNLAGAERIELLGQLGFHSDAVRFVTVRVLNRWWFIDRDGLLKWIRESPGFFEHAYWEEFIQGLLDQNFGRKTEISRDEVEALADVFFSLKPSDERRLVYFNLLFQHWAKIDQVAAAEFVRAQDQTREDVVLDKARATLAYQHAAKREFRLALPLLTAMRSRELRDWTLRDFSLILETDAEIQFFQNWLAQHGCMLAPACTQIDEQLKLLAEMDASYLTEMSRKTP